MLLSIVLCTRNRAEQLRRVLLTAEKMDEPGEDWEILIVDNGSTDRTAEVIASFAGRLPIRRVFEPLPGLSHARNRGIAEARGRYICWTDDDVLIDRGWLMAYVEAFRRHPAACFFGGRVEPMFDGAVPAWVAANRDLLADLLAARDLGGREVFFVPGMKDLPYGANFAVRATEQRRHPYDPALGVAPGRLRLGEESDVLMSMLDEGGQGVWVPGARVRHVIPAARLTLDYVASYYRASGGTWAYLGRSGRSTPMGAPPPVGRGSLLGAPLWLWRAAFASGAACLMPRRGVSRSWLETWIRYNYMRGALSSFLKEDADPAPRAAEAGAPEALRAVIPLRPAGPVRIVPVDRAVTARRQSPGRTRA